MRTSHIIHKIIQILFLLPIATPALSELQWPLKEKTYLTGTFGEFRRNHIHAGVDISTQQREGLPVYACDDGTLYRIKTEYKGYGKAVYIKLTDGKILVYAHLDRFNPEIEKILKAEQEKVGAYAIDFSPKENIPIKKGTIIGYSGGTGGVAPHLHLELRDQNENPINILKCGLTVEDKIPPHISGIAFCNPDTTYCTQFYSIKTIPAEIHINGRTGIAVSVSDPNNGNRLGIYQIDLLLDGKLFFTVKMDKFSYDEFRDNFLLGNKDMYVSHNKIYYNLFKAWDNPLPFYPLNSDGIIDLPEGKHSIGINAIDNADNTTSVKFNIAYSKSIPKKKPKTEKETWYSEDKLCEVKIEKQDLYYPFKVTIKKISANTILRSKTAEYCITKGIGCALIPGASSEAFQRRYKNLGELIPINVYDINPKRAIFKKAAITIKNHGNVDKVGLYKYEDGKWKFMDKNTVSAFTSFGLFKDITPPSIKIVSKRPMFKAKIDDKGSGLNYGKLELLADGKKVIAEYSINRKELFCTMPPNTHKITCIAEDMMENISTQDTNI